MANRKKERKSIGDTLAYTYLTKIKRRMLCPSCKKGEMRIEKKADLWECQECGYKLSAVEFEDNFVFWFCDECDTYLNNQEGFNKDAKKHICINCGYENDITFENVKDICTDCGKFLENPKETLCLECRQARRDKAMTRLKTAGKVAGVAFVAVQTLATVANALNGKEEGPADFTSKWVKNASLDDLKARRSLVEADYNNPALDNDYRASLYGVLHLLDKIIGERGMAEFGPQEPVIPRSREHGWYLPNDD